MSSAGPVIGVWATACAEPRGTDCSRTSISTWTAPHGKETYRYLVAGLKCGVTFTTLAQNGFFQHVESEQCGVCRFKSKMPTLQFVDELSKEIRREVLTVVQGTPFTTLFPIPLRCSELLTPLL